LRLKYRASSGRRKIVRNAAAAGKAAANGSADGIVRLRIKRNHCADTPTPLLPPFSADRRTADAKIASGEKVLFATQRAVPVLTRGNPSNVEIVVAPVK